ncbi:MAG: hypothetical protein ACO2ZM_03275 [Francisellaceae bacterium]
MLPFFHHIPTWVYIIFTMLIYIGIQRSVTHVRDLKRLLLMPVLMLYFSLHSFYPLMLDHPLAMDFWLLAFIISLAINMQYVKNHQIRADKQQGLIEIQGDWTWIPLLIGMFVIDFMINYSIDSGHYFSKLPIFIYLTSLCSGATVGIGCGRNLSYFIKFIKATHSDLVKQ